jgi:hypothetical protein
VGKGRGRGSTACCPRGVLSRVQSTDYGFERHEVGATRLARSANPTSRQADATQSRPYPWQSGCSQVVKLMVGNLSIARVGTPCSSGFSSAAVS